MSNPKKNTTIKFRFLCSTTVAGGVIGTAGSIIKRLERETSTKIQLDLAVSSSSKERLIHVYGLPVVNRRYRFNDGEVVEVSPVQDGLVRVFDRMLEVEPPQGVVVFRLVVGPELGGGGGGGGGGGEDFDRVCGESEAKVEVVRSPEKLPLCVKGLDQVVEISGDSLAVKKALVLVSRYMQQKMTLGVVGEDKGASVVLQPSMKMEMGVSTAVDRVNGDAVAEVVFKLLCPYSAAGFVIGYKGKKVKALEEETEASIKFSAPDNNYNERVVVVSAFENRNMQHSSAQNALVRVFDELMSSGPKEHVTARLVIQQMQIDVLRDSIIGISNGTGATLQLLEHKCVNVGVSSDEKIIQIDGEYPNVQTALFQVSWILREFVFNMTLAKSNIPLLPHKAFNLSPFHRKLTTLTKNMKACRVSEEVTGSIPTNAHHSKFPSEALSTSIKHPREWTTVKCDTERSSGKKSVIVTNTKVEIAVRGDVFTSVFNEDGNNLSRIRTISGAKVEVHDPSSGGDGKVIISGTPEQTLAAQSLLQAFINTVQ